MVQGMGWLGICNRAKAGCGGVWGQGFRHVRDKVGFTGMGFARESTFLDLK